MPVPLIATTSKLCDVSASLATRDREEQWEEHFKRLADFLKGNWGDTNIVIENHMGDVGGCGSGIATRRLPSRVACSGARGPSGYTRSGSTCAGYGDITARVTKRCRSATLPIL